MPVESGGASFRPYIVTSSEGEKALEERVPAGEEEVIPKRVNIKEEKASSKNTAQPGEGRTGGSLWGESLKSNNSFSKGKKKTTVFKKVPDSKDRATDKKKGKGTKRGNRTKSLLRP